MSCRLLRAALCTIAASWLGANSALAQQVAPPFTGAVQTALQSVRISGAMVDGSLSGTGTLTWAPGVAHGVLAKLSPLNLGVYAPRWSQEDGAAAALFGTGGDRAAYVYVGEDDELLFQWRLTGEALGKDAWRFLFELPDAPARELTLTTPMGWTATLAGDSLKSFLMVPSSSDEEDSVFKVRAIAGGDRPLDLVFRRDNAAARRGPDFVVEENTDYFLSREGLRVASRWSFRRLLGSSGVVEFRFPSTMRAASVTVDGNAIEFAVEHGPNESLIAVDASAGVDEVVVELAGLPADNGILPRVRASNCRWGGGTATLRVDRAYALDAVEASHAVPIESPEPETRSWALRRPDAVLRATSAEGAARAVRLNISHEVLVGSDSTWGRHTFVAARSSQSAAEIALQLRPGWRVKSVSDPNATDGVVKTTPSESRLQWLIPAGTLPATAVLVVEHAPLVSADTVDLSLLRAVEPTAVDVAEERWAIAASNRQVLRLDGKTASQAVLESGASVLVDEDGAAGAVQLAFRLRRAFDSGAAQLDVPSRSFDAEMRLEVETARRELLGELEISADDAAPSEIEVAFSEAVGEGVNWIADGLPAAAERREESAGEVWALKLPEAASRTRTLRFFASVDVSQPLPLVAVVGARRQLGRLITPESRSARLDAGETLRGVRDLRMEVGENAWEYLPERQVLEQRSAWRLSSSTEVPSLATLDRAIGRYALMGDGRWLAEWDVLAVDGGEVLFELPENIAEVRTFVDGVPVESRDDGNRRAVRVDDAESLGRLVRIGYSFSSSGWDAWLPRPTFPRPPAVESTMISTGGSRFWPVNGSRLTDPPLADPLRRQVASLVNAARNWADTRDQVSSSDLVESLSNSREELNRQLASTALEFRGETVAAYDLFDEWQSALGNRGASESRLRLRIHARSLEEAGVLPASRISVASIAPSQPGGALASLESMGIACRVVGDEVVVFGSHVAAGDDSHATRRPSWLQVAPANCVSIEAWRTASGGAESALRPSELLRDLRGAGRWASLDVSRGASCRLIVLNRPASRAAAAIAAFAGWSLGWVLRKKWSVVAASLLAAACFAFSLSGEAWLVVASLLAAGVLRGKGVARTASTRNESLRSAAAGVVLFFFLAASSRVVLAQEAPQLSGDLQGPPEAIIQTMTLQPPLADSEGPFRLTLRVHAFVTGARVRIEMPAPASFADPDAVTCNGLMSEWRRATDGAIVLAAPSPGDHVVEIEFGAPVERLDRLPWVHGSYVARPRGRSDAGGLVADARRTPVGPMNSWPGTEESSPSNSVALLLTIEDRDEPIVRIQAIDPQHRAETPLRVVLDDRLQPLDAVERELGPIGPGGRRVVEIDRSRSSGGVGLECRWSIANEGAVAAPAAWVLGEPNVWYGVAYRDDRWSVAGDDRAVAPLSPDEIVGWWGLEAEIASAVRVEDSPAQLLLDRRPRGGDRGGSWAATAVVGSDVTSFVWRRSVLARSSRRLAVSVPEQAAIDSVSLEQGGAKSVATWRRAANEVVVDMSSAGGRATDLIVQGRLPSGDNAIAMVAGVEALGHDAAARSVAVYRRDDVLLAGDDLKSDRVPADFPDPISDARFVGVIDWDSEDDASPRLGIEIKPNLAHANVRMTVRPVATFGEMQADVACAIREVAGAIDQLILMGPAGVEWPTAAAAGLSIRETGGAGSGRAYYVVRPKAPWRKDHELLLRAKWRAAAAPVLRAWSLAVPTAGEVVLTLPNELDGDAGVWTVAGAVEVASDVDPSSDAKGAVSPRQFEVRSGDYEAAWRPRQTPGRLEVALCRVDARIHRGEAECRARFLVSAQQGGQIAVQLPPEADLIRVASNGVRQLASATSDGVVALAASAAAECQILDVSYRSSVKSGVLEAPRLISSEPVSVDRTVWVVSGIDGRTASTESFVAGAVACLEGWATQLQRAVELPDSGALGVRSSLQALTTEADAVRNAFARVPLSTMRVVGPEGLVRAIDSLRAAREAISDRMPDSRTPFLFDSVHAEPPLPPREAALIVVDAGPADRLTLGSMTFSPNLAARMTAACLALVAGLVAGLRPGLLDSGGLRYGLAVAASALAATSAIGAPALVAWPAAAALLAASVITEFRPRRSARWRPEALA